MRCVIPSCQVFYLYKDSATIVCLLLVFTNQFPRKQCCVFSVHLITSVPGRHSGTTKQEWGHMKLRKVNIEMELPASYVNMYLHVSLKDTNCLCSDNVYQIFFSDDVYINLFCSDNDINDLCGIINVELDKLNTWFSVNKLSLNIQKTHYIVFGNKTIDGKVSVLINNKIIDRVYESKFLGVYIDSRINWKYHIDKTRCKLSKSLSILYKASIVLDSHNLYIIYCSIMMSYFSYCSEIWGGTYDSNIKALILLRKRAIRVVCKCSKYDHTNILFSKLSTLKLKDIIKYKTGIVMYRAYYNFYQTM